MGNDVIEVVPSKEWLVEFNIADDQLGSYLVNPNTPILVDTRDVIIISHAEGKTFRLDDVARS